jgi:hypothetical protein
MIKKCVITAEVAMSPTFMKKNFHIFLVFLQHSKSFPSAGNNLFCIMFKVLQASWFIAADFI